MAQQITNNSLILDSLTTAQTSYVDNSVAKFDNVLDVANKTFTKQNDLLSKFDSNGVVSVNTNTATNTNANSSTTTSKLVDNSPQQVLTTDTVVSSKDATNNTTSSSDGTIGTNDKMPENSVTVDDSQNDTKADVVNNQTDNEKEVAQETDEVVSTIDVVSKYTYLDNLVDDMNNNEQLNNSISEDTVSNVEIDNDTVLNDNLFDEALNTDTTNVTEDLVLVSTPVVDDKVTNIQVENNSLSSVNNTESVTVSVSDSLLSNDEPISVNTERSIGKDLISQKMVEDLNITIEDVSNSTQNENVLKEDSTLMDSTEQAVKYMMDKETVSESMVTVENDVDVKNMDTKDVVLKDIVIEKTVSDDVTITNSSDVTDNLVVDTETEKDIDLASESVNSDSSNDSQDVEQVADTDTNTDSSMEENNSSSEENAQNDKRDEKLDSKDKSEFKKNVFASAISEDVESTDTQSDTNLTTLETVSVHKGHSQQVSMTVASQTSASATNHVNISKEDVLAQIHSKLQMMNSSNNAKLTMILNPESLGKVSIQLLSTKDGLTAEMQVASQAVKDILDSNLSNLKDTLSAQGVQVNEVSVKVSQSENNAEMDYTEQEGNGGNKQDSNKQNKEQDKEKEFEKMFSMFEGNEEQEIEG